VGYFRVWAGFHHGYAPVPWWLYMRGGDSRLLDFARAETLHLMNVDLCQWHNEELGDSSFSAPERKHRGGLCDFKGVVHWNAGAYSHIRYRLTGSLALHLVKIVTGSPSY
jgi:hypothetical protein